MTDELETDLEVNAPVDASSDGDTSNSNDDQVPMYNKRQVADIVKRERQKALEKGKSEALMQLEQTQNPQAAEQQQASQAQQSAPPSSLGGMTQMSQDDIQRMIAEQLPQHLQNHVQQAQTAQTVEAFVSKMQAAEARHPGIEAKLNELDYSTLSPLIKMANDMENTADIMAELLDNPMKMGNLLTLQYTQPKLAQKAMHDLSNSIKQNQEASNAHESVNNPLGQLKPSANAGMDNGDMSPSDWSKYYAKNRR
jgi:hypothetical protein